MPTRKKELCYSKRKFYTGGLTATILISLIWPICKVTISKNGAQVRVTSFFVWGLGFLYFCFRIIDHSELSDIEYNQLQSKKNCSGQQFFYYYF